MNSFDQRPDFSFVVPLYNKAGFIGETLRSIAGQSAWRNMGDDDANHRMAPPGGEPVLTERSDEVSGLHYEIVVINDGSTDRSADVVRQFIADGLPIRYFEQPNAGVSAARNAGIAQARGEWTMCIDGDDLFRPDMVGTLRKIQRRFPQVPVVATGYSTVRDGVEVERLSTRAGPGARMELIADLPRRWIRGALLHVGATAFRTDFASSLQPCFPVGERCGEDVSFLFRMNHRTPFGYSPERMLIYRQEDREGLSLTVSSDELRAFWSRIDREFARDGASPQRRRSLDRFLARARELRAADLTGSPAGVNEARRLLEEVPWMQRDVYWWRVAARVLAARRRVGG